MTGPTYNDATTHLHNLNTTLEELGLNTTATIDMHNGTADLATIQASCITGQVSFPDVLPGDYVVEVDSRAVTPALRATAPVTVEPITDATVAVEF